MKIKTMNKVLVMFLSMAIVGVVPISADAATRHSGESRRISSDLQKKINVLDDDVEEHIKIPVLLGPTVATLADTWGDARSHGRTHEGIDIFGVKGMFVVSPTEAVVTSIGYGDHGGNYVYTTNAGGERYYFAHLDRYKAGLKVGDELEPGDLIGYVGNTGNASWGAPHLHFGIYTRGGVVNPYDRMDAEFSLKEKVAILMKILDHLESELAKAKRAESN